MPREGLIVVPLLIVALLGAGSVPAGAAGDGAHRILVRASKPYDGLVAKITALGGTVTHQYRYVDALAAEIPAESLEALRELVHDNAISKDVEMAIPARPDEGMLRPGGRAAGAVSTLQHRSATAVSGADLRARGTTQPPGYLLNDAFTHADHLFARNLMGQGIIVGVIDTGIRPGFASLESGHRSVVGCEDLVGDALGCSNAANDGHGTFVAGMIAAHALVELDADSPLLAAVSAYCPTCVVRSGSAAFIPLVGTAPEAQIYALRISATGGAPSSRLLAAVERVIELKEKFDRHEDGGVNIQVVNLSFGGPTLFPGRDLFDREVDQLLDNNIVLTTSAGNGGPSSLTIASPASSFASLTVGAAGLPINERILLDLLYGPGLGRVLRVSDAPAMLTPSSRGPNADGRPDPDVVASGHFAFGQGFGDPGTLQMADGTSFSAPTVAGVAALLRQAFPAATARQIRNAIIQHADPDLLGDAPTELDQGGGYVNALAAYKALASGSVPDTLEKPRHPQPTVATNVEHTTDLEVRSGPVSEPIRSLRPGQRHDILYELEDGTEQLSITLTDFAAGPQQNPLFGDSFEIFVHTARTSAFGDYVLIDFGLTNASYTIDHVPSAGFLDAGLMRITLVAAPLNAGPVSGDVHIISKRSPLGEVSQRGRIAPLESLAFPLEMPAGVSTARISVNWRHDWATYPVNDLDMYLVDPAGHVHFDGVTFDAPEEAVITNPAAGTWTIYVDAFELNTPSEAFQLRVNLDGKLVKLK